MTYLIDSNVISERSKPRGEPKVLRWLSSVDPAACFISALTVGEVVHGVERLPPGAKRRRLERWLEEEVILFFAGRTLTIDADIAKAWGRMVARAGRTVSMVDSWLAATAEVHGLTLATRNVRDVTDLGVPVHNPWT